MEFCTGRMQNSQREDKSYTTNGENESLGVNETKFEVAGIENVTCCIIQDFRSHIVVGQVARVHIKTFMIKQSRTFIFIIFYSCAKSQNITFFNLVT